MKQASLNHIVLALIGILGAGLLASFVWQGPYISREESLYQTAMSTQYAIETLGSMRGRYPTRQEASELLADLAKFCRSNDLEMTYEREEPDGYVLIISPRTLDNAVLGTPWTFPASARIFLFRPGRSLAFAHVEDSSRLPVVGTRGLTWEVMIPAWVLPSSSKPAKDGT